MFKAGLIGLKTFIDQFNRGVLWSSLTLGVSSLIAQFLMMIYLVLVARWLGAQNYSYIAAVYAIGSLTSFIFNGGLNEWMMTTGVRAESPGDIGGSVILSKLIIGLCWLTGLLFLSQNINPEIYILEIAVVALIDVWFDSIFSSLLVILVLKERSNFVSVLLGTSRLIRLLAGGLLILVGTRSILVFSITRLICTMIFTIITWLWAKPRITGESFLNLLRLYRDSSVFNGSEILNLINLYTEINLLSFLRADQVMISNYSIVTGLLNALMILPFGIYTVLVGSLIRNYKKNILVFYRDIKKIYSGFTILGILMWICVRFLGIPVIQIIMGNSYRSSGDILTILSWVLIFKTINQANISYLVTVGWQAKRLIPQMGVVIFKVVFGILLYTHWGIDGLILSAILSELVLLISYSFQVFRHHFSSREIHYQ